MELGELDGGEFREGGDEVRELDSPLLPSVIFGLVEFSSVLHAALENLSRSYIISSILVHECLVLKYFFQFYIKVFKHIFELFSSHQYSIEYTSNLFQNLTKPSMLFGKQKFRNIFT